MNAWAEAPGAHERNIIEGIRDVILLSSLPASHHGRDYALGRMKQPQQNQQVFINAQ
jgi:hypothetical protein